MDLREFFHDATLRICGSLDIETAVENLFRYVCEILPADRMLVNLYDSNYGVIETIASVNKHGKDSVLVKQFLSPEVRRILDQSMEDPDTLPRVDAVKRIGGSLLAELFDTPDASSLVVRARLEGRLLGALVIVNYSGQEYTPKHVELMRSINEPIAIAISNYLRYREIVQLKDLLADDNRYLREELGGPLPEEIVGADFGLKGVMGLVRQVASLESPVLLLGETGTGKEVIANAIHKLSPRRNGPIIKVNCGAIPESLLDSELFGHEKGAFTGAFSQKRGRFERADGGTIFLDEIGELPLAAQIRLLRVLQEKEIERVGGTDTIKVDIRIIAATHRDLEAMLEEGRFREDLYFRLRVFPVQIPPLRDRRADVPALVQHFAQKKARELGLPSVPVLTPGAVDRLIRYNWPGNVRELQNEVERALILGMGKPLTFEGLGVSSRKRSSLTHHATLDEESLSLEAAMTRHIIRALEMSAGRVGGERGAARLLRINPSTLRKKMRKLHIPFGRAVQKG